jgi:ammonium transporter, Amt family
MSAAKLALWDAYNNALDAAIAENTGFAAKVTGANPSPAAFSATFRATLDDAWTLGCAFFVMLMLAGFFLLEAGCLRRRTLYQCLFNNGTVMGITALIWWFCGYGFAFSDGHDNRNGFIGTTDILLVSDDPTFALHRYKEVFLHFGYAMLATVIQSGATGERLTTTAWLVHSILFAGLWYPIGTHWGYSTSGWFSPYTVRQSHIGKNGLIDLGGCGTIHMAGGASALAAILLAGKRIGRFEEDVDQKPFAVGSNKLLKWAGTLVLWAGWYGFNPGATMALSGGYSRISVKFAANTFLGPCAAALVCFAFTTLAKKKFDFDHVMTAALAGLVSVTGGGGIIEPWAAVLSGAIAALIYNAAFLLLKRKQLDDAVLALPVHLFPGMYGLLVPGIFATRDSTEILLRKSTETFGFLYNGGANQFGVQIFFLIMIFLWHFVTSAVTFGVLKLLGQLRVPEAREAADLDNPAENGDQYGAAVEEAATEEAQA